MRTETTEEKRDLPLKGDTHPHNRQEYDCEFAGAEQTPGIDYLHGDELKKFDPDWYAQLHARTLAEPHLLTKTREDLEPAVHEDRIIVAIDRANGDKVVGCIVLWPLCRDDYGQMWYELGTFLVIPEYRYGSGTNNAMPIGDVMYRYLLATNPEKNILGTTTNLRAIHTGMRHGMRMIRFSDLPHGVHVETCCCPFTKTGVTDNLQCPLKDKRCRVRISPNTWVRIGQPELLPFP